MSIQDGIVVLGLFLRTICLYFSLSRAVSVQDGMVVLDWKFDDVNGTYNTTHFEVGFLFSFQTTMMMMMKMMAIMI